MNESVIDPLQLVPHRVKVFKQIYGTYRGTTAADGHVTGDVSARRHQLDELTTKYSDEFNRTKRVNSAELW